ncbi:MAG: ATP-binding protein [Oscillospiraceae bacterium]|nr:ATP-binding protein [Oscillospiraceae bacterium]
MTAGKRPKPEHMTHLKGSVLVRKDHPRIVFRGYIDLLEAELLLAQKTALREGYREPAATLGESLDFVRSLIRCDVLGEKKENWTLGGYTPDELREKSHYPEKYFGQPHFMACAEDSETLLAVNHVRAVVRQTELKAYAAFKEFDGTMSREDIQTALNRLSSLMWIIMIRLKAGQYSRG